MSCEEIENSILDYQENQLPPGQRADIEAHLAGCASCRTFARQLRQLDTALTAGIKVPALSAEFDQRLQKQIQVAPAALSEAERAERKRQLQGEFEAGRARIGRGLFAPGSLAKHLAWPVLAILSGWLAWRLTLPFASHLNAQSLGGLDPYLLPWLVASVVFLMVSLTEVFPRQRNFFRF
jgi:anti-sigma factor RsiW